jgi:Domain of unknown function (DUF4345)
LKGEYKYPSVFLHKLVFYFLEIIILLTKNMKNLHLIISTAILIPVALGYGIAPKTVLPMLLNINLESVDMLNICRAIMVLYLALSALFLMGICIKKYWFTATITNIFLMGGLALGRILSLVLDGMPSPIFLWGTLGETVLAVFAFYQLRKWGERGKY